MRKILAILLSVGVLLVWGAWPEPRVSAQVGDRVSPAASQNGDVNGDRTLDIADAIYIINHLFSLGPKPVALAQEVDDRLVGTWRSVWRFPEPDVPFPIVHGVMIFHQDGTMTEVFEDAHAVTPASGIWEKIDDNTFAATWRAFEDFDGDGVMEVRSDDSLTISLDGDTISGTATFRFFPIESDELIVELHPTFESTRMKLIRE